MTYFENTGARRDFVELDDAHEQVCERRRFDMTQKAFDGVRLCLYECEHLQHVRYSYPRARKKLNGHDSPLVAFY